MTITTSGFYQKNIDNLTRLNKDVGDIQVQVSTGKKSLSLKHDVQEISRLNATEEHKSEISQFKNNAGRIISDLEKIDNSFAQLENATIRLQEIFVQTSNGLISPQERKLFKLEISGIKQEILAIANRRDAFGKGIFAGDSGNAQPFGVDNFGLIRYSGSAAERSLQVSRDNQLRQNFSGDEVFLSAGSADGKFSIFDAIDSFSRSLDFPIAPGTSSDLLSNANSVDLVFNPAGQATNYKFDFVANGTTYKVDSNVYGNDFNGIVAGINSHTGSTGVTAVVSSQNKITLTGVGVDLKIKNFSTDLPNTSDQYIAVQKVVASNVTDETILPHALDNAEVENKLYQVFDHFIAKRTELGVAVKMAQNVEDSAQETLVDLNADISKLEDADMAALLTKLQGLLTNKEAAQATFSRLTSTNLFDFLS
jgi:flagellar hook-associated protein 3 FlgL